MLIVSCEENPPSHIGELEVNILSSASDPLVTVVIMTYNRAHLIKKAINSVLNQTLKNWKVLIIDDGSTDDTMKTVEPFLKKDNRIDYYRLAKNLGICRVLNIALKIVDTKYMVQLDSDDWLENNALETLLLAMENADENVALAYSNHKKWKSQDHFKLVKQRSFSKEQKYEFLCHSTVYPRFYRTDCLRKVGGWEIDDQYDGRYMEDRRIQFKLIEQYDFLWVNEYLYNLNRITDERQSSYKNQHKYVELKKEFIQHYLKKWGDEYTPKFYLNEKGWLRTELIPKIKQNDDNPHPL